MNHILVVAVVMLIIWGSLLAFYWLKTDEIRKDPCTICAEVKGEDVICTTGNYIPVHRIYHPNGSIYDDRKDIKIKRDVPVLNFTVTDLLTE